jgi:hypothetical protein
MKKIASYLSRRSNDRKHHNPNNDCTRPYLFVTMASSHSNGGHTGSDSSPSNKDCIDLLDESDLSSSEKENGNENGKSGYESSSDSSLEILIPRKKAAVPKAGKQRKSFDTAPALPDDTTMVEPATDCRLVYIRSCCLVEVLFVVIERAARTIVVERKQEGFVRDRE